MVVEIEDSVRVCVLKSGGIAIVTDDESDVSEERLLAFFSDHRDMEPFWASYLAAIAARSERPQGASEA